MFYLIHFNFVDIDECASNPCQNNGSCIDGVNGYNCSCVAGFNGRNCETGELINKVLGTSREIQ